MKTLNLTISFLVSFLVGFGPSFALAADTNITTNRVKIGQKNSSNKSLLFDLNLGSANPLIMANGTTGTLQFSQDGVNFSDIGSGSGGGGGVGTELLPNPTFESGGVSTGWTSTGLTAAPVTSGANLIDGKVSAALTATAINQTYASAALPIKGLANGSCAASLRYLYAGATGDWALTVLSSSATTNPVGTISLPQQTNASIVNVVTFPCGSLYTSTLQLVLTSKVASPSPLYMDNLHLGSPTLYNGLLNGQPTNIVKYLSGSGTYTPTAGATQIEVYMVGGGGGGGPSGTSSGGSATTGATTTLGSILSAAGGGGGFINGLGGSGGVPAVTSPAVSIIAATGQGGGATTSPSSAYSGGGAGGQSLFGGGSNGTGGTGQNTPLAALPAANSGSGGGGAQWTGGTGFGGSGGGAGAYIDAIIPQSALAASYAYTVGIGGTGATAGASGAAGANGAAGQIVIRETFQTVTQQAFSPASGGLSAGDEVSGAWASCPTGTIAADGTAYQRSQYPTLFQNTTIATTATGASGATSITVPSTTGIVVGQYLTGAGITNGTTITAISGTTLTLSAVTTAALSSTSIIVYLYGPGDYSTTFNVPNFPSVGASTPLVSYGTNTITATTTSPSKGASSNDVVRSEQTAGDHAHIKGELRITSSGSSGSGDYLFLLPNGLQFDPTKVSFYTTVNGGNAPWPSNSGIGAASFSDATNSAVGVIIPYDATHFRIGGIFSGAAGANNRGIIGSNFFPLGTTNFPQSYTYDFEAPILSYASSYLKTCVRTNAASAAPILTNTVVATDNNAGTTVINTSVTYIASATIPNSIETAFGNTTSAAITLTLPDPTLNKSKKLIISKTNAGANLLGVTGNIAGTAGKTTYLIGQSENITLQSDGTTWQWISSPMRTEFVGFGGASSTTGCNSSPCTAYFPSSGWVTSITYATTGYYTFAITAGLFSVTPICSALGYDQQSPSRAFLSLQAYSQTSVALNGSNGANDKNMFGTLTCTGPR